MCEEDSRWRGGGSCSYSICQGRCEDGASLRREKEMEKKLNKEKKNLKKIQIQVESLKAENQRMKEEVETDKEAAKERAETYERRIEEQEERLESYKREMRKNEELVEQSFVNGEKEFLVALEDQKITMHFSRMIKCKLFSTILNISVNKFVV